MGRFQSGTWAKCREPQSRASQVGQARNNGKLVGGASPPLRAGPEQKDGAAAGSCMMSPNIDRMMSSYRTSACQCRCGGMARSNNSRRPQHMESGLRVLHCPRMLRHPLSVGTSRVQRSMPHSARCARPLVAHCVRRLSRPSRNLRAEIYKRQATTRDVAASGRIAPPSHRCARNE